MTGPHVDSCFRATTRLLACPQALGSVLLKNYSNFLNFIGLCEISLDLFQGISMGKLYNVIRTGVFFLYIYSDTVLDLLISQNYQNGNFAILGFKPFA